MNSPSTAISVEDRALKLLGNGVAPEQVAAALGVSASRISQLMANDTFKEAVVTLKYQNLSAHNERDNAYNSIEDQLLEKLKKSISLMIRPETILKAVSVINGAKRRGNSSQESIINQNNIVNVVLPAQVVQQFTTNIHNQVVAVGEESMVTMPSGQLLKQVEGKDKANEQLASPSNEK